MMWVIIIPSIIISPLRGLSGDFSLRSKRRGEGREDEWENVNF